MKSVTDETLSTAEFEAIPEGSQIMTAICPCCLKVSLLICDDTGKPMSRITMPFKDYEAITSDLDHQATAIIAGRGEGCDPESRH